MTDLTTPRPDRAEIESVVRLVAERALDYLESLDSRPVLGNRVGEAVASFSMPLPEYGTGASDTIEMLLDRGLDASAATSGPRCFHFVIGGVTPAALAADWVTSLLDQPAYTWISSPLGVELEVLGIAWLKDLFDLPSTWTGVMTSGATMSNVVGLASARQWWAERHGADVAECGFAGLPSVPVFSSGYLHASSVKGLSLLGIGRSSARTFACDAAGRLDLVALEDALRRLDGAPAILIGNAGEVNTGGFDPIEQLADLAERYRAWLHVDGAFGLFARVSPRLRHLTTGVERADSVAADGHKWLNVPYDSGFAFVRDARFLTSTFAYTAAYLPDPDDPRPTMGGMMPQSSRRARALAVWATLHAYGRSGYRELVEHHVELAAHLARLVDSAPDLERLDEVPLNIVCFRYNPGGIPGEALNDINRRIGDLILTDGRVFAGTTVHRGDVALRPAIVNWRTERGDVELFVNVVRELGRTALQEARQVNVRSDV